LLMRAYEVFGAKGQCPEPQHEIGRWGKGK